MDEYARTFTALWPTVAADVEGVAPTDTIRPTLSAANEQETLEMLLPEPAALSAIGSFGTTLGEGGMGLVRVAEQASMQREVAVKTLRVGQGGGSIARRLLQEAWVTGYLEHPNIVPVYDIAMDEAGKPLVLMKRIEGRTWQQLIGREDDLDPAVGATDALEWNLRTFLAVCNAVHFAHQRGVLHRDIKPENVMIGRFGEVYLLDWGIAVGLDDRHQGRLRLASRESRLAGTPRFMAPEMAIADGRALGPPTDVYLLGATLFAALVGHPPHQGEDLEALLCGIIDFDPDHPALPRPLVPILRRAMAPDPADRFQTVEALAQDIGRYLGHRDSYRLASRAEEEMEGLRATVSQGQVDAVHEAYARVRFACLQALEIWSDNAQAAATLRAAHELAVDHALAQRSAVAARAAVVYLDDPVRLAHVEALEVALAREAEELDAFRLDNDPSVAARGRTVFLALMVLSWFIMPILGQLRGGATWSSQVTSSCSVLLFLLVVGGAMRGTLMATEFNRRSAMTLLSIPIGQAVLDTALFVHGVAPQAALSARHALWAVIGLLYALLVAPGLLPSIAVIAMMAVVGAMDPGHAYLWSLVSNVALLTNAVFLWRRR